eukprot:CAMPEP_0206499244 /NCGR_PEP_ID=MMETSP0324_2-20121206/51577_1 /ASSEMBLY_ACC=CAM_ASM_000836 /TAXON_ID=2866 /ORGANISM="Crypthecodinium cohnii, Strain Seligo" /LENGTH=125 /DNA_ID=CAMNT_0053985791 /DNA_START=99 /DNA_END=474 /DNA_ORIENTATION=-
MDLTGTRCGDWEAPCREEGSFFTNLLYFEGPALLYMASGFWAAFAALLGAMGGDRRRSLRACASHQPSAALVRVQNPIETTVLIADPHHLGNRHLLDDFDFDAGARFPGGVQADFAAAADVADVV